MFYSLKGVVQFVADDFAVLEVNGLGYQLFADARTLGRLGGRVGEAAQLYVYTHVREDHIHLYGFPDLETRVMFESLLKVNGVGAKMALAIFAVMTPNDIAHAILMQDATAFTQASGVGKKLAERLVMELKGKLGAAPIAAASGADGASVNAVAASGVAGDVISALVNLGYKAPEARTAVQNQLKIEPDIGFDALFKTCLQELR